MTKRRVVTQVSYRVLEEFLKLPEGMHIARTFEDDQRGDETINLVLEDYATHRLPEVCEGESLMTLPIVFQTHEDGSVTNITWAEQERQRDEEMSEFEL